MARGERTDTRSMMVQVPPGAAFRPICDIGTETGWYFAIFLWRLRWFIDRLVGGPGQGHRRLNGSGLAPGDVVDSWLVEAFEPDRLLVLKPLIRLPGQAWLKFEVEPRADGSLIRQTAVFHPRSLFGLIYWYVLLPAHKVIFRGMLRRIAAEAERI